MAISTVTNLTTVTTASFNSILSGISNLIVTAYGSSIASTPITLVNSQTGQPNLISAAEWQKLIDDFQRVAVHQNGSTQTFTMGLPQSGSVLTRSFANELISAVNLATANSTTVAVSQLGSLSNSQTRTSAWGTEINHSVEYTWSTTNQAKTYFNLGSYVDLSLSSVLPASPNANDSLWNTLISSAAAKLVTFKYGFSEWTNSSATLYAQDTPTGLVWSNNITSSIVSSSGNRIYFKAERSGAKLRVTLGLVPSVSPIDLNVTSTITNYYSRGDVFVSGFPGIAAPLPTPVILQTLEVGGSVVPPFVPTRTLGVSTPSLFTWQQGSTSLVQTVTLTNSGNSTLTVTAITFTEIGGVTALGTYPWAPPAFPVAINSGSSRSFSLAYTGNTIGTYNNSFTISSDNDSGPVTVATQQTISAVPFTFTLSPTSWSGSTTIPNIIQQKFTIVPNDGSNVGTNYTAAFISGSISPGFFINTSTNNGPTVIFNPNMPGPGSLTPTLSVTCNGITVTAPITVTVSAPANQHLGSWRSPIQNNNSVVAMSYDVIAGQRYLTIGYGLGEDGSTTNVVDPSYKTYLTTSTLGITADTKYSSGVVAYEMLNSSNHVQFIKDYGVWIRNNSKEPFDVDVARQYSFTVPTSGTYNWRMSCDNEGYFTINGNTIGDMRGYSEPYTYTINGTVDLAAGQHTIVWYVKNFSSGSSDNPGGIAIQITRASDSLEVWNTQNAVRSSAPYQYWQEVYRIPIPMNGVSSTIASNPYRIKDSNKSTAKAFGDYFGVAYTSGGPFTVNTDGAGGINVIFNSYTSLPSIPVVTGEVQEFVNLPYYYSPRSSRFENLENDPIGDGTQTTLFLGFNFNGSVRTALAPYPLTGGGGGGGGCPDPNTPILLPDYSSRPAGELQPGDEILTVHEHSGHLGTFKISAVSFENQPRVKITFTDHNDIVVSDTHKFLMSNGEWKQVFEISVGETVKTISASRPEKEIMGIEQLGEGPVVKIEVEDAHTYIANGLISHNIKVRPENDTVVLV